MGKVHRFGHGLFCGFDIPPGIPDRKGLYVFVINGEVLYLGRCLTTFKKRLKEYGHISPSNCAEKNGQLTNCHVNIELNNAFKSGARVEVGISPMSCDEKGIKAAERKALDGMRKINPYWTLKY